MKSPNHDNIRFKDFRRFVKRLECDLMDGEYSETDEDSSEKAEDGYNDVEVYVAAGVAVVSIDDEPVAWEEE